MCSDIELFSNGYLQWNSSQLTKLFYNRSTCTVCSIKNVSNINAAFKLLIMKSTVNIQMVNKVTKMTVYLTRKVEEVKNPSNSVAVAALFRTIHQKLDGLFTNE